MRYPGVGASLGPMRRDVRAFAGEAGADAAAGRMAQAASEAAANAIVHGYEGGDAAREIDVDLARETDALTVAVGDHGCGFHPRRSSPGVGLGLAIIAHLADELELCDREGGGVRVLMRFSTRRPPAAPEGAPENAG